MQILRKAKDLRRCFPIFKVIDDVVINVYGEPTVGWELTLPPAGSVLDGDYVSMHSQFTAALTQLPDWCVVHKQDIFVERPYVADPSASTFFSQAYEAHFEGRASLEHHCYLYLTFSSKSRCNAGSSSSSVYSFFKGKVRLPKADDLYRCEAEAAKFISVLTEDNKSHLRFRRLTNANYLGTEGRAGIIYTLLQLGDNSGCASDIALTTDSVTVRGRTAVTFTVNDAGYFPTEIAVTQAHDQMSFGGVKTYLSTLSKIGVDLRCPHVVNEVFVTLPQQAALSEIDARRRRMNSDSRNASNRVAGEELQYFTDKVQADSSKVVRYHLDLVAWDRTALKEDLISTVSAAFSKMNFTCKNNTLDAPVVWLSQMPGAATELGREHFFLGELRSLVCATVLETYEKSLPGGLFKICDRRRNVPVVLDMQRLAYDLKLIESYNGFVLGPTGTGKSYFMNFMLRQRYDHGDHVFLIDVGDSYLGQTEVINRISGGKDGVYLSWDADHPFSFNPFIGIEHWLDSEGRVRQDDNGLNFFMSLVMTLWAPAIGWNSESESILRQIIMEFIVYVKGNDTLIFDDFYRYLSEVAGPRIKAVKSPAPFRKKEDGVFVYKYDGKVVEPFVVGGIRVDAERFDIDAFCLSLQAYSQNGTFGFLLNDAAPKDLFSSRWTVFEVDKLSHVNDKKFYSVCILCIMNEFDRKMRTLDAFKIMVIEEAWKAIANETMSGFIQELYKVSRKFRASAFVVTQQMSDILSSKVISDTIMANSPIKILLDQSANLNNFDGIQEMMGFTAKELSLIYSMNRCNNRDYNYKEVFISLGGRLCGVYATEVSEEEALAFESDRVKKKPLFDLAARCGDMKQAVTVMARQMRERGTKI